MSHTRHRPRQLPFPCDMSHLTAIQLPAADKLGTCKPKVCSPRRLNRQDACSPSCQCYIHGVSHKQ